MRMCVYERASERICARHNACAGACSYPCAYASVRVLECVSDCMCVYVCARLRVKLKGCGELQIVIFYFIFKRTILRKILKWGEAVRTCHDH